MKQTEKLQQQLKDGLTLVLDASYSSKYYVADENGNMVIERTKLLKDVVKKCKLQGLLK